MKARKTTLIALVAIMSLGFGPCNTPHPEPLPVKVELPEPPPKKTRTVDVTPEADKVKEVETKVTEEVAEIKAEGIKIKEETASGKETAPELPQWTRIEKSVGVIDESATDIEKSSTELVDVEAELRKAMAQIIELQTYTRDLERAAKQIEKQNEQVIKQNKSFRSELEDYESGAAKRQQTIWMSVVGFSAVCLALGIFMAIYANPKLGISMIVASIVLASVAYFMAKYATFVAIAGGAIVLSMVGMLIYTLGVNRKALIESITSFELAKDKKWKDVSPEVSKVQSKSTKSLVHTIKLRNSI